MSLHTHRINRYKAPQSLSTVCDSSGSWAETNGSLSVSVDGTVPTSFNAPSAYLVWRLNDATNSGLVSIAVQTLEMWVDTLPPAASGLRVALVLMDGEDISTVTAWVGPVYAANGATQTDPDVGVVTGSGESLVSAANAGGVDATVVFTPAYNFGFDVTMGRCDATGRTAGNRASGAALIGSLVGITDLRDLRLALVVYSDGSGTPNDYLAVTSYAQTLPSGFGLRAS